MYTTDVYVEKDVLKPAQASVEMIKINSYYVPEISRFELVNIINYYACVVRCVTYVILYSRQ